MSSNTIKIFLFCAILSLLSLPAIQGKFEWVKLRPLKGAIMQPEKSTFSVKTWFSGDYQLQEEKYLNESFGFRNLFIRIYNQIAFSFFNIARANGVIIGKHNYLFEANYISAYYGTNFIGSDSIRLQVERLKFIQDTLSKMNKTLVLVLAAGKGSFYPEYFPDSYTFEKTQTNCECYAELAKEYGVNCIDFNRYFVENKNKSKYPLFPRYGIHWSYYGADIATDSMISYLEKVRQIDMPDLCWTDIKMAKAKEIDYDIADGMNLLFYLKGNEMAYPVIQIQADSNKIKPSAIVIADSFYWLMFGSTFSEVLSDHHFWYYNKQVYPEYFQNGLETSQLNVLDEIQKHDIIIIMASESTLPKLGWGFIEDTYDLFKGINKNVVEDAANP